MTTDETVTIDSTGEELQLLDKCTQIEAEAKLEERLKYLEEVAGGVRKFELSGGRDNPHSLSMAKTAFEVAILLSKLPLDDPKRLDQRYIAFLHDYTCQAQIRNMYNLEGTDSWMDELHKGDIRGGEYKNLAVILYGYSRLISDTLDNVDKEERRDIHGLINAPKEELLNGLPKKKESMINQSWKIGNEYLERAQAVIKVATRP